MPFWEDVGKMHSQVLCFQASVTGREGAVSSSPTRKDVRALKQVPTHAV